MKITRMWGEYKSFSAELIDTFGFVIFVIFGLLKSSSEGFILPKSISIVSVTTSLWLCFFDPDPLFQPSAFPLSVYFSGPDLYWMLYVWWPVGIPLWVCLWAWSGRVASYTCNNRPVTPSPTRTRSWRSVQNCPSKRPDLHVWDPSHSIHESSSTVTPVNAFLFGRGTHVMIVPAVIRVFTKIFLLLQQ